MPLDLTLAATSRVRYAHADGKIEVTSLRFPSPSRKEFIVNALEPFNLFICCNTRNTQVSVRLKKGDLFNS